jgi:hypothetical protein
MRVPPWLKRRGLSDRLKNQLSSVAKVSRATPAQDDLEITAEPQHIGRAIELQQYLNWRMAKDG